MVIICNQPVCMWMTVCVHTYGYNLQSACVYVNDCVCIHMVIICNQPVCVCVDDCEEERVREQEENSELGGNCRISLLCRKSF